MSLTKYDTHTVYTITDPNWICEWVVFYNKSIPIRRSCLFTNLVNTENSIGIIPGLLDKVHSQVRQWIMQGDVDANLLLLPENKPQFLRYAESIIDQVPR